MRLFVIAPAGMAVILLVAGAQRPRVAVFVAAILWLLYAYYEYQVATGVLCDANCNIRVDLVLFFPVLGLATFCAYRSSGRRRGQMKVVGTVLGILGLFVVRAAGGDPWLRRSGVRRVCCGCSGHHRLCGQIEVQGQSGVTPTAAARAKRRKPSPKSSGVRRPRVKTYRRCPALRFAAGFEFSRALGVGRTRDRENLANVLSPHVAKRSGITR